MPARSKRDVDLSTPTARARLKAPANRKPFWRFISEGRFLGYRRFLGNPEAGTWCARYYDFERKRYVETSMAAADDKGPADGEAVLSYRQALDKAMAWCDDREKAARGIAPEERGPYTVARCVADYLAWFELHREALKPTRYALEAHVLPALGGELVADLSLARLKRWHQGLASRPPRLRSGKGATEPRFAPSAEDLNDDDRAELLRKRKSSANRVLTILKAALNHAYHEGKGGLTSDAAWRKVKPFRGVDAPKIRYLTAEEVRRLLNACEADDFRLLVEGALHTGARYSDLRRSRVRNYMPDSRSLYIPKSKAGKERHIFLSDEGARFFEEQTAGRRGEELIFRRRVVEVLPEPRTKLEPWGESHQHRRMREACKVAQISPPIGFNILRHTYASHYLMNGGSLPGLAQQLGHSDTRMTTRHYAHLADRWRAAEAREHALGLGGPTRPAVERIRSTEAVR